MAQTEQKNQNVKKQFEELQSLLERAMALQTSMVLFEWDDETLAPKGAAEHTARVIGSLSEQYQEILASMRFKELLDACRYYFDTTGRRVTIEYAVINGVNNTRADAGKLAKRLHGMQCHVNLIPVNPIKERSFRSFRKDVERFQKELTALGINATIRRTLGSDIQAACGQLRRDADAQRNAVQEST